MKKSVTISVDGDSFSKMLIKHIMDKLAEIGVKSNFVGDEEVEFFIETEEKED